MKQLVFCFVFLCLGLLGCENHYLPGDSDAAMESFTPSAALLEPLTPLPVQLSSGFGGRLLIGDPPLEYPYDARGKASRGMMGRDCEELGIEETVCADLGPLTPCQAYLYFKEEDLESANMYVIAEWIPIYIEIQPNDMVGIIDFSDPDNVEINLGLDSIFQPVIFGIKPPGQGLSVVTTQTTGTSGDFSGEPMDRKGDFFWVSVALVPETEDFLSNLILGLPTEAVSLLPGHMDFPLGRYYLCENPPENDINTVELEVLKDGSTSMDFLGAYTTYLYDGKGSNSISNISDIYQDELTGDTLADVSFQEFEIPILEFIPGIDTIGVRIEDAYLDGSINFSTGELNLYFDAKFTPFMGDYDMPSMSVVTLVTTESQDFYHHDGFGPLEGTRLDKWGHAKLVGIADVPALSGDTWEGFLINIILGLPNDAVCELPVHLDFHGGNMPAGWPPPDVE